MSFPHKLKLLRAEHNMTQKELARRIHVARATIAGYETRDRQPSYDKLAAIADVFHVSVDYLLDNKDDPAELSLDLQQERLLDQRVLAIYQELTLRSKEDAYEYLCLLKLREKQDQPVG